MYIYIYMYICICVCKDTATVGKGLNMSHESSLLGSGLKGFYAVL
jgi:hypothetical protein